MVVPASTPHLGSHVANLSYISRSCKPQLASAILLEDGMREALEGKMLISILAGVTISQIKGWVSPETKVIRAMPNTPCKVSPPTCK
jgi:pyrroline-5-carboxylate reductase